MFGKKHFFAAVFIALCVFCVGSVSHAASNGKRIHVRGHLIDNACWNEADHKDDPKFLHEHTKNCLQMPDCIKSGYSVVTAQGQVYKMDAASNASTTAWIEATKHEDNWLVDVKGHLRDGKLNVQKIQLAK